MNTAWALCVVGMFAHIMWWLYVVVRVACTDEVGARRALMTVLMGEHEFDGGFETLGDSNHYVSSEHPEDVVEKESSEKNTSGDDVIQMQKFHSVDSEGHA